MRLLFAPVCLAAPVLLGGCAEMAAVNAVASAVDTVAMSAGALGSSGAKGPMTFEQAATTACAQQTLRYGAVKIITVNLEQRNPRMLHVSGRFETATGYSRPFSCAFGSDGRVSDFRV